ncbi:leucine-rich repeat domain-containing protein [Abyssalbus ytuae]|uniref:Leucine-rich repeat domain-containing protein n=1 Tax=Abyssalbus ytuae TaxID=2926907 RepID=A0A9E6ZNL0_9FLAO|nr:leucine-rich repeat domain-containing protein [Abyssalbus ytuae]UOB19187.1 leucine-rich repeat domain-containing protein [Abyssalbus ytuae]
MKKYFYVLLFVAGGICMTSCNKDDDNPSPKSDAKQIISFVFKKEDNTALNEDVTAEINQEDKTITATVPFNTNVTSLFPLIEVSEEATVSPTSARDFTNEVTYTVTAKDGTQAIYKISVEIALNNATQITGFVFKEGDNKALNEDVTAEIDHDNHTIIASIPASIDVTSLTPSIEVSEGAAVSSSGPQECSNEIIYTVTAQDDTQVAYTFTFKFTATTEKEVLIAIYKSNPCNTLGWDITIEDLSEWTGITLDDEGKVIQLSLYDEIEVDGYGLTILPAEIGKLRSLEKLNLSGNKITELPTEIGKLLKLKHLDLKYNPLSELPTEISLLANLQILYLFETKLIEFPKQILQLTNLEKLDLSGNQITSLPIEIGLLTNLETLLLSNIHLVKFPGEILQLTNLEKLNLSGNQITSIPTEIEKLISLVELDLSKTHLVKFPGEILQLTNLEKLNLSGNQLTSIPTEIGELTSLVELDLQNTTLTSIPSEIGLLTSLEFLFLEDNQLTSIPAQVCDLKNKGTIIYNDKDVTCETAVDD